MKAWYHKELEDQALYLNGKAYRFDLMETEDEGLIALLDSCAAQHKGGIIKLTAAQYAEALKKKKLTATSLPVQFKREEIIKKIHIRRSSHKRSAAAGHVAAASSVIADPVKAGQEAARSAEPVDFRQYRPATSKGVVA